MSRFPAKQSEYVNDARVLVEVEVAVELLPNRSDRILVLLRLLDHLIVVVGVAIASATTSGRSGDHRRHKDGQRDRPEAGYHSHLAEA